MKSFDCKQCKVSAERSIFLTGLFKKLSRGGETHSDTATVTSRRMVSARFPTPGNTWDHVVTVSLSDGSEAELFVTQEQFQNLSEGQQGQLTWEGENLLSFEAKE